DDGQRIAVGRRSISSDRQRAKHIDNRAERKCRLLIHHNGLITIGHRLDFEVFRRISLTSDGRSSSVAEYVDDADSQDKQIGEASTVDRRGDRAELAAAGADCERSGIWLNIKSGAVRGAAGKER